MKLRNAWEKNAPDWVRWAREPGHDSYWRFHRERFLALLPEPGRLTVDVGCSEGRVTRDLRELGHKAVGVDSSETMLAAAREADPGGDYVLADAAALPFPDGHADLVVAFMSLMDVDDMPGSVGELARVVEPGGRLALAVVHPINSGADRAHSSASVSFGSRMPAPPRCRSSRPSRSSTSCSRCRTRRKSRPTCRTWRRRVMSCEFGSPSGSSTAS